MAIELEDDIVRYCAWLEERTGLSLHRKGGEVDEGEFGAHQLVVAERCSESTRGRWWLLAAAAVVGIVGLGLLALADGETDTVVTDTGPATSSPSTNALTTPQQPSAITVESLPTTSQAAHDGSTTPANGAASAELRSGAEVVVFESPGASTGWDLAAQDPETGEVRDLVATDGIVDCPDTATCRNIIPAAEWSADGRWLAFTVSPTNLDGAPLGPCAATMGVWVKSALDDPRQLTTACDATPTPLPQSETDFEEIWRWSPANARLAYARVDGAMDELVVIDPSDGSQTSLGTVAARLTALGWSPDGTRIAYSDGGSVYQVDVDGGQRSLLADTFDDVIEIAWSPDGSQILVHDQGRYRIQVMNADGSDLHPILEGADACCSTAWSPQGDRILYMLSLALPGEDPTTGRWYSEVWTVSPDGSNPIKIFDSSDCDMTMSDTVPVWAPNGTQIGYRACTDWVIANADGTGATQPIGGFAPADLVVPLVIRSWDGGGLTEWDLELKGQRDH